MVVAVGGDRKALVAEVSAALARPPVAVLIVAGPGMGKSWLVNNVLAELAGRRVVVGCRGLPTGPYVLVREVLGCLAGAEPALAAVEAGDEYAVCRAVRDLLAGLSLLVVEDVECADVRSVAVLRYLAARLPDGLSLVLTGSEPALGMRWDSAASQRVLRVELEPLALSDVEELAGGGDWAAVVHSVTGGVPLFVRAVLAGGPPVRVPRVVGEVVVERLAGLPGSVRRVLAAASVLRGPVAVPLLARVCGLAPERVTALLLRAVDAGLLARRAGGGFEFTPPIAGLAMAQRIPAAERTRTHAAVVRALAETNGDAVLAELVHHSRAAGDLPAAARYGERAAERAVLAGDTADAVELLGELLREPALPSPIRAGLARRLGRLALTGLTYDETVRLLRGILADTRLPAGLRGELRLNLALLLGNQAGNPANQRAELTLAVRELRRRPALAARAMAALAVPYWDQCHLDEHLWWLAEAERTVPTRGDPALLAAVAVNRASALLEIGDPRGWAAVAALPSDGANAGARHQLVRGYANFADATVSLGHHAAAGDFLARADELASRAGPSYPRHLAVGAGLRLALASGRWAGLAEAAQRHLEAAARHPFASADASLVLGQLALARGEWDEAEEFLRAPGLRVGSGWCGPQVTTGAAARVRLGVVRDRLPAALDELGPAIELLRTKGVWAWASELVDAGVEALLRSGDPDRAAQLVAEFAADVSKRDCPLGHAMVGFCEGAIAASAGRSGEAIASFADAARRLAVLPRPYEQARAIEAAAGCQLAEGSLAALDDVAEAAGMFTALGAIRDAARCAHLLREHGGTPAGRRGRRGYGQELSPREQEVAHLISLGRTNKQIAEVLFLSPRTVERHVASVLRKLGAPSREQLIE